MEVHKSAARVFGVNPCRRRNEIFRRVLPASSCPRTSALTYNRCPAGWMQATREEISVFLSARDRDWSAPEKPTSPHPFAGWKRFFTASRGRLTLWMGSDSRRVLPRLLSSPLFFLPSLHPLERGEASTESLYVTVVGERSREQWRAVRRGRKPLYNFTPNLFHNGANKKLSRTTYSHHGRGWQDKVEKLRFPDLAQRTSNKEPRFSCLFTKLLSISLALAVTEPGRRLFHPLNHSNYSRRSGFVSIRCPKFFSARGIEYATCQANSIFLSFSLSLSHSLSLSLSLSLVFDASLINWINVENITTDRATKQRGMEKERKSERERQALKSLRACILFPRSWGAMFN